MISGHGGSVAFRMMHHAVSGDISTDQPQHTYRKKLQKPTLLPHHESYKHASRSAQYVSSYRPVSRVEWSGERLQIVKKPFLLSVGDVRGDGTGSSILGDRGFGFLLYFIFIV